MGNQGLVVLLYLIPETIPWTTLALHEEKTLQMERLRTRRGSREYQEDHQHRQASLKSRMFIFQSFASPYQIRY